MKATTPKIIVLGPQGAGKGTQAGRLVRWLHIPHISTGEILREEAKRRTPLGRRIKTTIDAGGLMPDALMMTVMKKRLRAKDCRSGWLVDGYPRSVAQARLFDSFGKPNLVIFLRLSDAKAIKRLAGRVVCPRGHIYHLHHDRPKKRGRCDHDGLPLRQRDDDTPAAIRKRLHLYHTKTEPLIKRYGRRQILVQVDATPAIPIVYRSLLTKLSRIPWLSSQIPTT